MITIVMVTGFRFSIRAIQETTTDPITPMKGDNIGQSQSSPNWKVKMLYDGDCPLCMREVYRKLLFVYSCRMTSSCGSRNLDTRIFFFFLLG